MVPTVENKQKGEPQTIANALGATSSGSTTQGQPKKAGFQTELAGGSLRTVDAGAELEFPDSIKTSSFLIFDALIDSPDKVIAKLTSGN
jgi:hypothetical protein